uniref:Thiol-disulfide oxidoreductase dcc n=1 Tax=Tetraselmis sp. GSL018 TaxID=582737 RepID=A0A061RC51_9CHLO
MSPVEQSVLLVDGDCVLCNGFVKFLAPRAPNNLYFETQQSDRGSKLLEAADWT